MYETSDTQLQRRGAGGEEEALTVEEKHLKCMRRNRESAAMSRNRKKCYIEELEARTEAGDDASYKHRDSTSFLGSE